MEDDGREKLLIDRLAKGEKVQCEVCGKGYYIPYNSTADKAHYFNCSNPDCDGYFHWDPMIEIE